MTKIYPINPTPKPRMTARDCHRPAHKRYFAFKDLCRVYRVRLPECGACVHFHIAMPKSWPKSKKQVMAGCPHRQKPDVSNLLKALEDALYDDDSAIWHYNGLKKTWDYDGSIEITIEG